MEYEIQLDSQKRRVWVHASDGSTVARFDARFGMDIHNTVTDQMNGKPECLHCTHREPTVSDWQEFRTRIYKLTGIEIPFDCVNIAS